MKVFIQHSSSAHTATLNAVHLILPGATGHIPSHILRTLQSTGHVIYLEGAYLETASTQVMLVEEILKHLSTLTEEARITEIHSYCAGIIPTTELTHHLKASRTLADSCKVHCYDPPFYPMPAATPALLCEKMLDGFKQGLSALLIEKGFPLPDFTSLTIDEIENMEMLFCKLPTWLECVFSGNAGMISLGLAYCHNLLMQIRSSSIHEEMIALAANPSLRIICYFSDSMWHEEKMATLKTAAPLLSIQKCPLLTHGQMMGTTAFDLEASNNLAESSATKDVVKVSSELGLSIKSSYIPPKSGFFQKITLPPKFATVSFRDKDSSAPGPQ